MTDSHDIAIVDAHQHFWDLGNHRYPWLDPGTPSIVGDTSRIRASYDPGDYRRDAGSINIIGSIHLDGGFDPSDPVGETRLADRYNCVDGLPNAIVAGVDFADPRLDDVIQAHRNASLLFRGVRQITAWHEIERLRYVERADLMADGNWRRGYDLLRQYGLSADMQIYPGQMPQTAELAAEYPDTPMIINQAGMPEGLVTGDHSAWRRGLRMLAKQPNVSIKISGFGMLKPDWTTEDIQPLIEEIVDVFGTQRVMMGSNYPVEKLFTPLPQIFATYLQCLRHVSPDGVVQIASLNAIRIYRLALGSPQQAQD